MGRGGRHGRKEREKVGEMCVEYCNLRNDTVENKRNKKAIRKERKRRRDEMRKDEKETRMKRYMQDERKG